MRRNARYAFGADVIAKRPPGCGRDRARAFSAAKQAVAGSVHHIRQNYGSQLHRVETFVHRDDELDPGRTDIVGLYLDLSNVTRQFSLHKAMQNAVAFAR